MKKVKFLRNLRVNGKARKIGSTLEVEDRFASELVARSAAVLVIEESKDKPAERDAEKTAGDEPAKAAKK